MGAATASRLSGQPYSSLRPRRVAVMPAFNEAATIAGVLDDLIGRIDRLVIVDDGSVDATGAIVDAWALGREGVSVVHFPENRGLSAALRAGWEQVRELVGDGTVSPEDVAFSIDADGQHEPEAVEGMIQHLVDNDLDCVIARRDLSYHTGYKQFGNRVMTWIGRASGGFKFEDIESGYRVFRIGPLLDAQQYYRGYKYSETVEVAVILSRLGYRMCNSYPVTIPVARTRTRMYDAVVDAVCMPFSWYRLEVYQRTTNARLRQFAERGALVAAAVFPALLALGWWRARGD